MSDEPLIAVFVDFENLAIGVRDMKAGKFQVELVLKRLLEKGRIVFKRAYCDWRKYEESVREFHAQGVEMIDIPQSKMRSAKMKFLITRRIEPNELRHRHWQPHSRLQPQCCDS